MATGPKARLVAARFSGLAKQVAYPVGTLDILFHGMRKDGSLLSQENTLRLLVSPDECRQLARHIDMLAQEIEAAGGTKQ